MLRKLLLVGLLTIVERGSVLQICVGIGTCLVFLVAHVHTMPFSFGAHTLLKLTEFSMLTGKFNGIILVLG